MINKKFISVGILALSIAVGGSGSAQAKNAHAQEPHTSSKTSSTKGKIASTSSATPKIVKGVYYSPAAQKLDIARVERYLNSLTTMTADFIQLSPNKTSQKGKFFLARPGKLRWEYSPVPPVVIVARNGSVTYYDKELDQVSHVTTDDPLASILTRKNIRLAEGDLDVIYINKPKGNIVLSVVRRKNPQEGRVTFTVKEPSMELEAIEVVDAAGNITDIQFSNIVRGTKIDDKLFSIQPKNDLLRNRAR